MIRFQDSQGGIHYIPHENLGRAWMRDRGLKVISGQESSLMANEDAGQFDFSDLGGQRVGQALDFSDLGGQRVGEADEQQSPGGFFGKFGSLGTLSVDSHPQWVEGWPASAGPLVQSHSATSTSPHQPAKLLDFSDIGGQRVSPPTSQVSQQTHEGVRVGQAAPSQPQYGVTSQQDVGLHTKYGPDRQYTPDDELRDMGGTHEGTISPIKAVESGKITPLDIPSPDMHLGYWLGRWASRKLANLIGHPELAQQAEDAMAIHIPDRLNRWLAHIEGRVGDIRPTGAGGPTLRDAKETAETPILKRLPSDVAGEIQKDPMYGKRKIYDPVAIVEGLGQGAANTLAGLSTPENVATMAAMGEAPRPLNAMAGAAFASQMAHGAVDQGKQAIELYKQGKSPEAIAALTGMSVNAVMAVLSAKGAVREARISRERARSTTDVPADPANPGLTLVSAGARTGSLSEADVRASLEDAAKEGRKILGVGEDTRLRLHEQATVPRLVQARPDLRLRVSEHIGAEYVDQYNRSYDQVGDPKAARFWNEQEFLNSIKEHLDKSNDFTVVDMTPFTTEQITIVNKYIDSLPEGSRVKIIKVGF